MFPRPETDKHLSHVLNCHVRQPHVDAPLTRKLCLPAGCFTLATRFQDISISVTKFIRSAFGYDFS